MRERASERVSELIKKVPLMRVSIFLTMICVSGPAIGGEDVYFWTLPDSYPWSRIQIWGEGARK